MATVGFKGLNKKAVPSAQNTARSEDSVSKSLNAKVIKVLSHPVEVSKDTNWKWVVSYSGSVLSCN